eukprot:TRINITY_DN31241_c0_g1_i1.p1 TRINITY_DN31241_c0_g1~~TRINITY_DN31241_c0_g1_i1.p1  ORF type:complete len:1000 (+),score=222.72 TRINITY_DN31241_c0_g1_i1:190-3189(+)
MKGVKAAVRGAQESLGFDSPSRMKGLQVFIADIRNCQTKEQEQQRVDKELAKIRLKFTNTKSLSGYDKKKYIWKLLYAYMLGYEIDFGHFQAVELCSATKFSEKTAGYLAVSLLLADNADMVRMIVNSVKNDMNSQKEQVAALALNTVANIGGSEFADNLFADLSRMILSSTSALTPYIKRKACICLLRLYRKDSDSIQPEVWQKKLAGLFLDRDIGLLTSASGFMLGILEMGAFPVQRWIEVLGPVCQCLGNLVQGDCLEHYEYYHVPAPWLQTKLLRILQFYPASMFDAEIIHRLNIMLQSILQKPSSQRSPIQAQVGKKRSKADAERQNQSNAEHAILFEAMNLMIHLEEAADGETTRTAAGLLGTFLSSTDPNIRYLGLETMARMATNIATHEYMERYKALILDKMREPDISIRRQALNLLYALCRPENWQQIVDELLEILSESDALLQEELVLKIAILAEKNAPSFVWYVDVVFKMLESAPDAVSDDVWYRVVQVVTGFDDGQNISDRQTLQRHAAGNAYKNLTSQRAPHDTLLRLGAYLIGEFGHLLPPTVSPRAKFEALHRHYQRCLQQTKAILLMAISKLLNANPDALKGDALAFLNDIKESGDVELQQRAVEVLQLSRDEDSFEQILAPMPAYAESVQQNNPLIQRLKFSSKNRAHTRAQLEEAAKSEGGMYKPGVGRAGRDESNRPLEGPRDSYGLPALGGGTASGAQSRASSRGRQERNDSTSESESDEDSPTGKSQGQNPKELWTNLCITSNGKFYNSPYLALEMQQQYNAATGRLTITYMNQSRDPIGNIRVQIPDVPFMKIQQFSEAPSSLRPGEQAKHLVQVQCLRPFLQPARYLVEYCTAPNAPPQQLPFMLPAVITKFIAPAEVQMQQFRQFFESLGAPGQESMIVGQAKLPPNQWLNLMAKGFNMFVLPESSPNAVFAAGTLSTATPDQSQPGKMMTVPCLVRVEYDSGRQMARLTVRTQHAEVSSPLAKIIESYLLVTQS